MLLLAPRKALCRTLTPCVRGIGRRSGRAPRAISHRGVLLQRFKMASSGKPEEIGGLRGGVMSDSKVVLPPLLQEEEKDEIGEVTKAKQLIACFEPDGFNIGSENVKGSVMAFSNSYVLWKPTTLEEVTTASLQLVFVVKPTVELLVIGCGARMEKPPCPELQAFLQEKGVQLEMMDTPNACKTFNVLNGDGRRVAAALLCCEKPPVPEEVKADTRAAL
ncbi:unnamed protein product [Chrysoparadoxa australica]